MVGVLGNPCPTEEHDITNVSQVASFKEQTVETTAADAQLRNLREFMKVCVRKLLEHPSPRMDDADLFVCEC